MIRGRPFEVGNKFGRGRPRGSRNQRHARCQQLLDQYGEAIIQTALALAMKGDTRLLNTLLAYLLRRPADRPVRIGPLPMGSLEDLVKSSAKVVQGVTSGKLSLGEGRDMASLIEGRRRVVETEEWEKRLRRLEQLSESQG